MRKRLFFATLVVVAICFMAVISHNNEGKSIQKQSDMAYMNANGDGMALSDQHKILIYSMAANDIPVGISRLDEMFYGEWEITENIYVDSMPVYGLTLTKEEIEETKEDIFQNEEIRTVTLRRNTIILNHNEEYDIAYSYCIFPAVDNYRIYFTLRLQDIGLLKENGNYFVYIEAKDGYFSRLCFFIKDINTIIVYQDDHAIEYRRPSPIDEDNQFVTIIEG